MKKIPSFIIALLAAFGGCGIDDNTRICPEATCADYATQQQAQAHFDSDPECAKALDADNDGIACEHLPASSGGNSNGGSTSGGTSNCPTTSNCGCSGIKKDQCGGSCCKWVVGSGCRCR